jgi:glycerophosphoryl diester phosphodiesterase
MPITARAETGGVLVIGHRGASGYRPENTLAAHELAVRLGADRIEPDVVPTADGALVLRHESDLSLSTDVAERPELAARRVPRQGAAGGATGWRTEELTLEQVRAVRAVEPRPSLRQATTVYDGLYPVPTFGELLDLAARLSGELGRTITVTAEVKDPARFAAVGLDVAALVVDELVAHGVDVTDPLGGAPRGGAPAVALQCFDPRFLVGLREDGVALPLVQLVHSWPDADAGSPGYPTPQEMCAPGGLAHVASYAQVLAASKDMVLPVAPDGSWGRATALVDDAHAVGLDVHVYTLRNENAYLPPPLRVGTAPGVHGRALAEHLAFARAGVDGVFTDFPDTAVEARRLLVTDVAVPA